MSAACEPPQTGLPTLAAAGRLAGAPSKPRHTSVTRAKGGKMYRLTTFGGLSIAGEDGPLHGAAAQSRRLALLAALAAAPAQGTTRDKVAALLWPESSAAEARHALRQLLSLVRRELGEDAVLAGSSELRLNPQRISTDIQDFEAALAGGEFERAATLYTGPFLDGFFLNGAAEFERWTEDRRTHFARKVAAALESGAEAAAQRGDQAHAIACWRRVLSIDRFSSRVTLNLMHALVAAGDSAAALQHARVYEALLREELGAEPDPTVVALTRRLQQGAAVADARPTSPQIAVRSLITEARPAVSPPSGAARHRAWLVAALLAVTAAAEGLYWRVTHSAARTIDRRAVVVVPFRVVGADASLDYLDEGMLDLLAAQLSGQAELRIVDQRAVLSAWRRAARDPDAPLTDREIVAFGSKLGAGHVLLGSVVGDQRRLVLTGSLLSVPAGRVEAHARAEGTGDSLTILIDRFVGQLLITRTGASSERGTELAGIPLAAIREYLDGQSASRGGRYHQAVDHFARALDIDSTFALAGLELAVADLWLDHQPFERALRRAWAVRQRLGVRDRNLFETYWKGIAEPLPISQLIAAWERAVAFAPDRPEVHNDLGELFYRFGPLLGYANWHERAAANFSRALALDSSYMAPRGRLVQIAAQDEDTAAARRLARPFLGEDSLSEHADFVRWRLALALRDTASRRRLHTRIGDISADNLWDISKDMKVEGIGLEDQDWVIHALRATVPEEDLTFGLVATALNRGRPDEANHLLSERGYGTRLQLALLGTGLVWSGDSAVAIRAARQLTPAIAGPLPTDAAGRAQRLREICWVEQWRLVHGELGDAERMIRRLESGRIRGSDSLQVAWFSRVCAALLRATFAVVRRRADARTAVDGVDSLMQLGTLEQCFNLMVARLRETQGDLRGALAAVRRRSNTETGCLAPMLRDEGRLAAASGDREEAVRAYRHYLALRDAPEPRLVPEVARVRAELARLESP